MEAPDEPERLSGHQRRARLFQMRCEVFHLRAAQWRKELQVKIQHTLDALNGLIILYKSIPSSKKNEDRHSDGRQSDPLDQ